MDLNDFVDQLRQMKKMGSMQDIMGMIPGIKQAQLKDAKVDERQFVRLEGIIMSMTPKERKDPSLINFGRKKRIAAGCGQRVEDVNRLLKQFDMMQQMTKQLASSNGAIPKQLPKLKGGKGKNYGEILGKSNKKGGFRLPF